MSSILLGDHGTTRVSLAGVLASVSSTDHGGGDAVGAVVACTLGVGDDVDINLLEFVRLGASRGQCSPPSDSGHTTNIEARCGSWKTDRRHNLGEGDRTGEGQDGEVIVKSSTVVVGMVSDGRDGDNVGHGVAGVMFSEQDSDTGG